MNSLRLLATLLLAAACALAVTPSSKKKAASKSSVKKTAAKKTGAKKKSGGKASWRNTQRLPTPERYKEIQQALVSKGYLASPKPSGVWDSSSVEALKKFQVDQNLEPSGKLDSLSLIALGLGPKRDQAPSPQP